jgi:hypothetical protein
MLVSIHRDGRSDFPHPTTTTTIGLEALAPELLRRLPTPGGSRERQRRDNRRNPEKFQGSHPGYARHVQQPAHRRRQSVVQGWYGSWLPGKSGIAFKVELLPAVADAFAEAVAAARASGALP